MARLGQLLLQANLISESNLSRALGVQHFAGGRLGTLLLERGSVNEDDLGRILAHQHGCEYVPWRTLGDIASEMIALLPAKFAIKHAAVPYERGENHLKLALRDPGDLRILDELFFVTGRKVVPGVAPEVRIYQALEKYYGERRTPRFAILAEKLSRPARPSRAGVSPPPPPPAYFPAQLQRAEPVPGLREIWGEGSEADFADSPIIQSWKIPGKAPGGFPGAASPLPGPPSSEELESISWEEAVPSLWLPELPPPPLAETPQAREPAAEASARAPERADPPQSGTARGEHAFPMPSASDFPDVLASRDRDSAAGAALKALSRRFPRSAIFVVKPEGVWGWGAAGEGVDVAALRKVEIPWTEPSVFLNMRLSRSFYVGPLPPLPKHEPIVRAFGERASECVVQPVMMREKPVAFLYAEFPLEAGATPMDLAYMRELAGAVGSALAAAIRLKKKEI